MNKVMIVVKGLGMPTYTVNSMVDLHEDGGPKLDPGPRWILEQALRGSRGSRIEVTLVDSNNYLNRLCAVEPGAYQVLDFRALPSDVCTREKVKELLNITESHRHAGSNVLLPVRHTTDGPKRKPRPLKPSDLSQLEETLRTLREKSDWHKSRTLSNIGTTFKEESNEVLETLDFGADIDNLKEELGDVLFHVVMMAQIAEDTNQFTLQDVIDTINKKMWDRNPTVLEN
ncbi:hypothetical protein GR11A_00103 [Vibrio phage vB_VcorM_GR11A]|nr:hypothetical protein GR11A_00103 [Vibrio phage vB_VcorM_GR11A]